MKTERPAAPPTATAPADNKPTRASPKRTQMLLAIRTAAVHEFSLHGLNGTSTQAIAERVGLTKPHLHYYIDGKEEIYKDILLEMVRDWQTAFAFTEARDTPAEVLEHYIRAKLRNAFEQPEMSRIITREVLDGGKYLEWYWPNARAATQRKVDIIDGWIAAGLLRPLDARLLLQHIWATTQYHADYALESEAMRGTGRKRKVDREHVARELVALILGGCLPPPKLKAARATSARTAA